MAADTIYFHRRYTGLASAYVQLNSFFLLFSYFLAADEIVLLLR